MHFPGSVVQWWYKKSGKFLRLQYLHGVTVSTLKYYRTHCWAVKAPWHWFLRCWWSFDMLYISTGSFACQSQLMKLMIWFRNPSGIFRCVDEIYCVMLNSVQLFSHICHATDAFYIPVVIWNCKQTLVWLSGNAFTSYLPTRRNSFHIHRTPQMIGFGVCVQRKDPPSKFPRRLDP